MEQKDKSGIQKDIDRLLERHLFDSLSIERFIRAIGHWILEAAGLSRNSFGYL